MLALLRHSKVSFRKYLTFNIRDFQSTHQRWHCQIYGNNSLLSKEKIANCSKASRTAIDLHATDLQTVTIFDQSYGQGAHPNFPRFLRLYVPIHNILKLNWNNCNKIRLFGIDWAETLENVRRRVPLKWTRNLEILSQSEKFENYLGKNNLFQIKNIIDNIMVKFWIERSKILASFFSISFGETLFE